MAHIKSRKHPARTLPSKLTHTTAALALLASPGAVFAQQKADEPKTESLPAVKVKASVQNDYKADRVSSPKFTQPLVDTPQTITVIKKEILLQQGATTLTEALRNTPGITFQMGENGNTQTGDSVFMRGFDTQQSIFVDGIRDIGTVSRDVFNLEQIEVVKGPAGADIGRGSPTGYINLSTKVPSLSDATTGTFAVGSGDLKRGTLDVNRAVPALGDGTAVRLNVLWQDKGVPKRDWVEKDSWALAPSLALGLNTPTRTYLYYLHVNQKNRPDGGYATFSLPGFNRAQASVPEIDRTNYYGSLSDYDHVKADMFTARIEHDLKPGVTLRNISRFGRTEQKYVLTGINAVNFVNPADPYSWTIDRRRQGKDQENQVLTNQTNLNADFTLAGMKHSLSSGIEFIYEKQTNLTQAPPTTNNSVPANLYNPSVSDTFDPVTPNGLRTSGSTVTAAVYAFDTLKINDAFQVNAGLRYEKYKTTSDNIIASTAAAYPTLPVGTLVPQSLGKADDLITWKVGGLWKPNADGSVYAAYATSQKPPGSDSFALNATATNINSPNLDPSKATNIEIGTKWELLDKRLALTAAAFHTVTENDVVDTDAVTGAPVQTGKKTVKGLEFGAAGMLSTEWQINAGLTLMDSKINSTTAANTATQQGSQLAWSPKLSFTSWTTYKLPFGVTIGGGARFMKAVIRSSNNTTSTNLTQIPSYWVFDAMASYDVTKNTSLQLNVYNLADKFYLQSLNNGGSRATVGVPRSFTLAANVKF